MFTPKTALFTFFAACALGVVACQPADGPAQSPAADAVDADAAKVAAPAAQPPTPASAR